MALAWFSFDARILLHSEVTMPLAVIFDIDGTLLDSVDLHTRAWQETFARYGIQVTFDEVRSQIGKGGDQLMPVFVPKDMLQRLGKKLEQDRTNYFHARYLPEVRAFPQVRKLFERIRADNKKIVLASSAKDSEITQYKKIANIEGLTDADASSDDAERSKPHPDIFLVALEELGNPDPASVVAVGDTPYDAQAAKKAGIKAVGVLSGGFPEKELRSAGCIAVYRDPADLLMQYASGPLA
jgi:HAD superfamily hydrolase (TIGR01509 family)